MTECIPLGIKHPCGVRPRSEHS